MKLHQTVAIGCIIGIQLSAACGHAVSGPAADRGVHVAEWTTRGIAVGEIEDMAVAGKIARAAFDTGTVESFIMGEGSNANMQFFRELKSCETVERVVLTNIQENKIDLTKVLALFPNARSLKLYFSGKVDASFAILKKCEWLEIDGPISPESFKTILGLDRLDTLSFFIDERLKFTDLEKLVGMRLLEDASVYPVEGFRIPKEWVEKLNGNAKLRGIIEPVRSGWIQDSE